MVEVSFIAHAGFCVRAEGFEVLIDPWLTSNTFQAPGLQSVSPVQRSIDYLIPEAFALNKYFKPDAILLSHLHSHHSNLVDIQLLIERSGQVVLGTNHLQDGDARLLVNSLGDLSKKVRIVTLKALQSFMLGPFQIVSLPHCKVGHVGWLVKVLGKKVIHLADSSINRHWWDRRIDPVYLQLKGLEPDLFFASAVAQTSRQHRDGAPTIIENWSMGPYEAARLADAWGAKASALMGIYSMNFWRNRSEYTLPVELAESQFRWACKYLRPSMQVFTLRPGCKIQLVSSVSSNEQVPIFY